MKEPGFPSNEAQRVARLEAFDILDTPAEPGFDDLVEVAAELFQVPIALVSLVDVNRQWFKARKGLDATETPRAVSFCGHVVTEGATLVVRDARQDARFLDNPLCVEEPNVVFYAGAPLMTDEGETLGTLCVIDHQPHEPTASQIKALEALARAALRQMEYRLQLRHSGSQMRVERARRRAADRQARCLEELHTVTSSVDLDASQRISRILEIGARALDLELAIVSRIRGDEYMVVHSYAEIDPPPPGTLFALGDTYCSHVVKANQAVAFDHAGRQIGAHPCYQSFGLESYVGTPLIVNGRRFGTLNFSSPRAREQSFTRHDFALVELLVNWIVVELAQEEVREEMAARRLRDQVEEHVHHHQRFFDVALEMLAVANFDGYFTELNPAWEMVLGFSLKELMSQPYIDFVHPDDRDRTISEAGAIVEGKEVVSFENRYLCKDGSYKWLLWSGRGDVESRLIYAVARDISDRKRVERMKNEFVSTVSHELRTPLTSIRGSLGLIVGGAMGEVSDEVAPLLKMACDNTDRLVRLINDMLDIDKIESGTLTLQRETMDLCALAQSVIASNATFADENQVHFTLASDTPRAQTFADKDRITQVLDNLLSNAAKYAAGSGEVEVTIRDTGDHWQVGVRDQGPGISKEFQSQMFKRFSQADGGDTRRVGGTGLGLAIARSIVELHGGSLRCDSQPGEGTRFYFGLHKHFKEPQRSKKVDTLPSRGRALIVEDDADVAQLIQVLLAQKGLRSDIATTAADADAKFEENQDQYAFITLDIGLPDKSGLDLYRAWRNIRGEKTPPVIVISVRANDQNLRMTGEVLGIAGWVPKPIDPSYLANVVRNAMKVQTGKPRVLHLEDDPSLLEVTRRHLESLVTVVPAESLHEGRELIAQETFDLAIVDLGLPDGSGREVIEEVYRARSPFPIIIYSGEDVEPEVAEMAEAVLVKSRHTEHDLLEKIEKLVDRFIADSN